MSLDISFREVYLASRNRNGLSTNHLLCCVLVANLLLVYSSSAHAQIARSWNTGSGSWSTPINWSPNGVPAFNDGAFIGNLPAVENSTVFLDIDDVVSAVNITDGMSLQTNGNTLTVVGDTTISGRNTVPIGGGNLIHPSEINLIRGTNSDDYDTDNLTVTDGGAVDLHDGAILEVDETLEVDSDSRVGGEGVIRFTGAGTVYVNDGILDPGTGGMTINVLGGGAIDLDGTSGNGWLSLSSSRIDGTAFDNLTINGGTIADPFGGEISITANGFLAMNIVAPWSTSSGSEIRLTGNFSFPGPAIIRGVDLTIGGELNVIGANAYGLIEANTTFVSSANVMVNFDDRLQVTGTTTIDGGTFTAAESASIDFDGPTTWSGDITATGLMRQRGDATVSSFSVIDAERLDMDGTTGATQWNINAQLVVNADRIDTGNNRFDGTFNIGGGFLHRLTINLSDPSEAWVMDGTLNLNGAVINSTKLSGSPVDITGTVNANSRVGITADATFSDSSELNFANAITVLRMQGQTAIAPGTTLTGEGTLENGVGGLMSLEAGLSTGQVGVQNRGQLQSDNAVGVVAVDRFENFAGATLVADVGKNNIGTDSDVLSISSGTAELAGDLLPRIVQLSGTQSPLVLGDSFTVLTAVSGVNGVFDNVLDSLQGGLTYIWDAIYNPSNVVVEFQSVSGLLGDYDYDGDVDGFDFLKWQQTFGSTTNLMADGNLDGVVDGLDLAIWEANYGMPLPLPLQVTVPEPSSLLLFTSTLLMSAMYRRRR